MKTNVARKTCPVCRQNLSAGAFNDSARAPDGLARTCRACTNARRRKLDAAREKSPRVPQNLATILRRGDIPAARKLLRTEVPPPWSWICETLREGHLALAEVLLEAGAERNAFTLAALANVTGLKRRLRRQPADAQLVAEIDPACEGVTPLHVACATDWKSHGQPRQQAQVEVATLLVEAGADVNQRAKYRGLDAATPLLCACWSSENLALVRWLLDHGALPDDRDFMAALGHFQRHRRPAYDIAQTLLDWGLPIDGSQPGERTPLQAFSHQAAHKTVAWLIERGANVNAVGPGSRTAAHYAAERNPRPTTLALLVAAGADLRAADDNGHTPLEIARRNDKTENVQWIRTSLRQPSR